MQQFCLLASLMNQCPGFADQGVFAFPELGESPGMGKIRWFFQVPLGKSKL